MLTRRGHTTHAACAFLAALVVGAWAVALSSRSSAARAASIGQLRHQIAAGQGSISSLAGAVGAASRRIVGLDASIATLARRLQRIQADLNAKRSQLEKLKQEQAAARRRLAQLESYETYAEQVLARQLVASYESDDPSLVSVVLSATGFQDLLEKLSFMQRVRKEDVNIIDQVRAARRAVAAEATRLGKLEVREQELVAEVQAQRNRLASTSAGLEQQRAAVARFRGTKAGMLASARAQVAHLQRQLSQLQAAQAALAARAAAAAATSSSGSSAGGTSAPAAAGPVSSAGGFVFPLPKSAASPPGTWSPDQGVDISAPGDTPEYAVCSGTVVPHGIGGFGPWAPVLHCDGSIDGYDYVYYGHAGPLNQLSFGTHVGAGQVMSSVGPGIVGISTGPHLEIGFADSSGSPIGAQTAGAMLSLLQAAYNG
jgi:peptidoglycan hydrolase CwlO-like protein